MRIEILYYFPKVSSFVSMVMKFELLNEEIDDRRKENSVENRDDEK